MTQNLQGTMPTLFPISATKMPPQSSNGSRPRLALGRPLK